MPLLFLLFIVVPIAELYVIVQVAGAIGIGWTVLILFLDSILGSMLLKSQGRAAWRRFNVALSEGRPPARETIDGALVLMGGALLLTPGFLSDILGLVLLIPPTRAVVRRMHRGLRVLAWRDVESWDPVQRRVTVRPGVSRGD